MEMARQFIGTPLYMAPEISKSQHSGKCDVWSLGISVIELLTGVLPRGEMNVIKVAILPLHVSIIERLLGCLVHRKRASADNRLILFCQGQILC